MAKTLASLTLLLLAAVVSAQPEPHKFALKVLASGKGEVTAFPYVSPRLQLHVDAGPSPKEKDVLYCTQETMTHKVTPDHADQEVVLSCEEGQVLTLKGVYLDE